MVQSVDGVLLLDKAVGMSSNAALQRAKRLLNAAKAGHTGTLDPLASGLLPLCFGEATKFAQFLLDAEKTYLADVQLGRSTTTGDSEGEVIFESDATSVRREDIDRVLRSLIGESEQTPPMYSALKHKGRPLYAYARAGQTVQRASRRIVVHRLDLLSAQTGQINLRLHVSKGTYIRALAQEIGERLGCGAHLASLRREATGGFTLEQAVTLEQLEQMHAEARLAGLLPVDRLAASLPPLQLSEPAMQAIVEGRVVPARIEAGLVRLYGPTEDFLGIGEVTVSQCLRPKRLLNTGPTSRLARWSLRNSLAQLEEKG
ncbi:MAG TPA: tRNA pseudouridine(55) synthase TruB [Burkholderiales bacterium]|nr:tRNA pseudouridine(55) synthase TruB [Burkholderiales bacterium]